MNYQSLEQAAIEACLNIGVQYKNVVADNEWHSTSLIDSHKNKGNGRIKIFSDLKGGVAFNWVTGQSQNFFVNRMDGGSISEQDRVKIEAEQQRRQAELIAKQNKAALKAQSLCARAKPAPPDHPYLKAKHIAPHHTRQADWEKWVLDDANQWKKLIIQNALLIPLFNDVGVIRNVQAIFPTIPPELSRNKDFMAKAELAGLFSWVGDKTATVCLCEGVATGFTVHEETGWRVYIAFTANNLLSVAQIIRKHLPEATIVVCADNDEKTTGNPGLTKATEAAVLVDGLLAVPPIAGDFNDYAIYLQGAK